MVLLDTTWCHKVKVATGRVREAGIEGKRCGHVLLSQRGR